MYLFIALSLGGMLGWMENSDGAIQPASVLRRGDSVGAGGAIGL
jgi:hypothetical protein